MSTVGHFLTMLGVVYFFFLLFESKLEKKATILLASLIARFNKRANYYLAKLINFKLQAQELGILPSKTAIKHSFA
jgi:uncharacterized membrane protein